MRQTWPLSDTVESDVACIEELVGDLVGETNTPNGLMREHLEEARFYLLGAMPEEYHLNLMLAKGFLPAIEDGDLQTRIGEFLRNQLH